MKVEIEHTFTVSINGYDIETTAGVRGDYIPGTNNGPDCEHASHGRVTIFDVDKTLADMCDGTDDEYRGGIVYRDGVMHFTRQQFIEAAEEQFEAKLGELMEDVYEAARDWYED